MRALLSLLVLIGSVAMGQDPRLPTLSNDPAELNAFMERMIQEHPWTTASGVAASMRHYLGTDQRFLPAMLEHPEYKHYADPGRPFMVIHIERRVDTTEEVSVLKPEVVEGTRRQITGALRALSVEQQGQSVRFVLEQAVADRLEALALSDPKGILTGMVACLPKERRAEFFRLATAQELLEKLESEPLMTDEALRAGFKGAAHGILPEKVSRESLFRHVRTQLEREAELVPFLRARWVLAKLPSVEDASSLEDLKQHVARAPSEWMDINETDEAQTAKFFSDMTDRLPAEPKELRRRAAAYLERVERVWRREELTVESRPAVAYLPYLTLREVPAYLAVHRSAISQDCGTPSDFAFPYSPLERNFFLFDNTGHAFGYVGTTILETQGVRTLYVHDVTGAAVSQPLRELACESLYSVLPNFGVERMTISLTGYCPYPEAVGEHTQNQYLDAGLRRFFAGYCQSPHGDRPEDNVMSALFRNHPSKLEGFRVRVEGVSSHANKNSEPLSREQAFLQLLDIEAAQPGSGGALAYLGFEPAERDRVLSVIWNSDALPLDGYYQRLRLLFEEYGVPLSENFFKRHEQYFMRGHLQGTDVFETANAKYRDRSLDFVIALLRRGPDRELAYRTLERAPGGFFREPKFLKYVETVPVATTELAARVAQLIRRGVPADVVAPTLDRLNELTQAPDPLVQAWALSQIRERTGVIPVEKLRELAALLDNEGHENDDASTLALNLLSEIQTEDLVVNKSLSRTVKYEMNLELAHRAAIQMLKNGIPAEEVGRAAKKNKELPQLHEQLLAEGLIPPENCAEVVSGASRQKEAGEATPASPQ